MKSILSIIAIFLSVIINAQEIKFGKVSKEELEEKFYPLDSTADAAYLYKGRKTFYEFSQNSGFRVINEMHLKIKIYNKEGFNKSTFNLVYLSPDKGEDEKISNIKGYTYNIDSNGKIVKKKLSKKDIFSETLSKYRSSKKITMPNVNEGTVIELKYILTSPYERYIDELNFQTDIPIKLYYAKIETPEWYMFKKSSKGYFSIPPVKSSREGQLSFKNRVRSTSRSGSGFTSVKSKVQTSQVNLKYNIDTYTAKNISALKNNERYVSNIKNYYGGIKYELSMTNFPNSPIKTYSNTWEKVCNTIYNSSSFGNELNKTSYYKNDLANVLANKNTNTQKVNAIFNFVKSKVKWNNYNGKYTDNGVKKAYKEGTGNVAEINLMLTSMLRFAGLKANPVLVSTRNNGISLFPTKDGFNYLISKVTFENGDYVLLDATEKYATPNILPYRALNWYGREINENGGTKTVNLTPERHTTEDNKLYVKINALGEINGMLRKSLTGHIAMFYRQKNNLKKEEDFITSLEEKYDVEIDDFKVFNKESLNKPISQTIKFTGDSQIEEINNKLYFSPLFFLTSRENPFKTKERSFPVDYGMPWQDKFFVSITIPENYTVESYPKELAIGLPDNLGVFKYQITVQGNQIKLASLLKMNSNIITPQYYDSLRLFYKQLIEKKTEKIVLAKK
ncbi:transglutaminase-like domain-containing protein [uncultured Tenacibaculum sp.]|uniref:transglutaminase-like domain-containing protein n=1 Tax=uncultured Tenacibaculum sp. TaxID=174713 RepID=UPI00261D5B3D|nr:transglutaminase-like domain-containing protein [uncultured Tenacibaculum sp.]